MAEHNINNHPTLNEEPPKFYPRIKLSVVETKEQLLKFIEDYKEEKENCCFCEHCLDSSIHPETAYILAYIHHLMDKNGIIFFED